MKGCSQSTGIGSVTLPCTHVPAQSCATHQDALVDAGMEPIHADPDDAGAVTLPVVHGQHSGGTAWH